MRVRVYREQHPIQEIEGVTRITFSQQLKGRPGVYMVLFIDDKVGSHQETIQGEVLVEVIDDVRV